MAAAGNSADGWQWTPEHGLRKGVPSIGVIQPARRLESANDFVYDVVVVGLGYAGLTAVRDSAAAGLKVLALEARDRIGGRSWSSDIESYPYEMGGTWVHWGQPHVWREVSRYDMRVDVKLSLSRSGLNCISLATEAGPKSMSHEEEDLLMISALDKFMNVDGDCGRAIMPFPHNAAFDVDVWKFDKLTCQDRLDQIHDTLSANEKTALEAFLLLTSGSSLKEMSFFESLHWWSLCGHNYRGALDYLILYKFKRGQSSFAINFWREAERSGNMSWAFNTPIKSVEDHGDRVEITSKEGEIFRARRMISAIPLNVLEAVSFTPSLSKEKSEAIAIGHNNQCVKVHAEVSNNELRSWSGINSTSSPLIYSFGDGTTPAGNTHIVSFGAKTNQLEPEDDIQQTIKAVSEMKDMDIKRLVFHNWGRDEYAKGAWFFPGKDFLSRYLDALRARHGSIFFASSDWALGWRSFIDGAIEDGARAAFDVKRDLM